MGLKAKQFEGNPIAGLAIAAGISLVAWPLIIACILEVAYNL